MVVNIKCYMAFFRANFPEETVTPKQHLLEEHTIPWLLLLQWRVSLAMLGLQDGESVHCQLNTTSRDLGGYHNDLKLTLQSVKNQWLIMEEHTIPSLLEWGVYPALLGEQGGESVHCQLNTISRDLKGYHDDLKLTLQSVKNQWLMSSPSTYHKFSTEK